MGPRRTKSRPKRSENRRGLVVTEGTETEKQYVERLGQFLRTSSAVVSVKTVGVGKDPRDVVKKCVDLKAEAARKGKEFDWCVCLVDVDQHTTLQDAFTLASANEVMVLVTNLKFEMWLLWHAADIRSAQTTAELDRLMVKYGLLQGKHLPLKFPIDKLDTAMHRASLVDPDLAAGRIGPDPSSAFPVLVNLIREGS